MLTAAEHAAPNVVWLDDYRTRHPDWDGNGPPPLGGRKASHDTLLSETVVADAADALRHAA